MNNRLEDLNRIAASLVDPHGSDFDAINAERTARWAAEDAAKQGVRGPQTGYQGYSGAPKQDQSGPDIGGLTSSINQLNSLLAPKPVQPAETTFEQDINARDARIRSMAAGLRRFQQGGKIDPEELLRRMSSSYGVSNQSQPTPAPAPKPVVQPQPAPQPGSLITGAANALKGRTAQIDKAAGYANGGRLSDDQLNELSPKALERRQLLEHRRAQRAEIDSKIAGGGKIQGPGTPTSDSIPAKVRETGENILVSNKERIVSAEQDIVLERIAEMLGFESIDAMFEKLTGKPVGPTRKAGRRAAATGMRPGVTVDDGAGGVYTPEAGFNPVQVFKDSAVAARTGRDYQAVKAEREAVPYSNEGRSVPHPVSVPANRAGARLLGPEPIDSTPVAPLTTKDVVPGGYLERGADITAHRGKTGQLTVTNAPGGVTDDSASALRDQQSNNPYWSPAAQLERMQRRRMTSEATDPTITDPSVRETAQKGLLLLNAGQATQDQGELRQVQLESAKRLAGLHGRLLDPKTPIEEQKQIASLLAAMNGKTGEKPADLRVHDVEELIDPKQPLLGTRKVPHVFDPRTGQARPMLQSNDATAQAKAAIARGADPKAVNARLRSMGLPEVQ